MDVGISNDRPVFDEPQRGRHGVAGIERVVAKRQQRGASRLRNRANSPRRRRRSALRCLSEHLIAIERQEATSDVAVCGAPGPDEHAVATTTARHGSESDVDSLDPNR